MSRDYFVSFEDKNGMGRGRPNTVLVEEGRRRVDGSTSCGAGGRTAEGSSAVAAGREAEVAQRD
jgi:hypothetical protein